MLPERSERAVVGVPASLVGNSFLAKDVDDLEKKWAAQASQAALL